MGVLYGFASASVKRVIIVLMYASCESKIACILWSCVTCIPSNQLTGLRSMSAYHLCSFPLYAAMSLGELPVIVQSLTCTTGTSMCLLMCTMNTPGSAPATQKPKSVMAMCNASYHLHPACFKPYSTLSSPFDHVHFTSLIAQQFLHIYRFICIKFSIEIC